MVEHCWSDGRKLSFVVGGGFLEDCSVCLTCGRVYDWDGSVLGQLTGSGLGHLLDSVVNVDEDDVLEEVLLPLLLG